MGFVVVSLLSVCVLATLAIACTVCLTVSVVPLGPAVRVVQDVCTVRASTILVNFCFSLVSGIPFNAALSTLGVPVSRLVVNTLDAFRVFSFQLSIQLLSFAEIYGPGTPLQYCVLGKGIGCGPRGRALNKLSGRLVDYAQAWFFFGIRARFISPTSASSLIWIILGPSLILSLLVSLWILFSFEAPLDDNDLRLINTLNSIINRAFKKLSAYSRRLRLTLSSSAAVLLAVGVLWPTSILRALCYNIPISRRTAYLEGSAAGIRCDRNSFYDFYKRLGYLLLATTLRSLSLCVATLIAIVFVAYVCLFLHTIWNAYFTRKAIAACPLCHPAVEQVQSIADSNTDLDAVLTISYPPIKAVDIHPRFPENYYIHAEFTQKYELGSLLGEGGHGFVIQARRRSDGQQVAVKFVLKGERAQYWDEHPKYGRVSKDVIIMDLARHENIIALLDVFNDDTYLYIVQEVFGDVWHPAQDTPHGEIFPNGSRCLLGFIFHHEPLCSEHALYIFYQLVDAVAYLHSLGISHCDIKPENILIDSNLKIKLIDFGSCLRIPTDIIPGSGRVVYRNSDRFCGTRTYMPPELHLGKQFEAEAADVWAMGIVLFFLLAGYPPFWTIDDIKARHIRFPDIMEPVYWESIIPQWYILGSCFRGNPRYRPTAAELQMREGFMPVAWARQQIFGQTISCCVHMQDNGSTSQ